MEHIKFYSYCILATFFVCLLNLYTAQGQNLYPTAKGSYLKIDGGGIDYVAPVTTGGWARGISFFNSDRSTRFFGIGMFGSADQAARFYIGFDAQAPWTSTAGIQILANGNVGVGTINPLARLAVNGNILATEIKIKTDINVPDYVFDPDYQLPTLSSIEDYVKKNRHLPEIPSAADIQKDGVDLTAMNLALLKKVEELTLHMIDKDKRIEILEKKLDEISNK